MTTYYEDKSLDQGYSTALFKSEDIDGIEYTISYGSTSRCDNQQEVTSLVAYASGPYDTPSLVLLGHVKVGPKGICMLYWTKLLEIGGIAALQEMLKLARADGAQEALEKVRIALGIDS